MLHILAVTPVWWHGVNTIKQIRFKCNDVNKHFQPKSSGDLKQKSTGVPEDHTKTNLPQKLYKNRCRNIFSVRCQVTQQLCCVSACVTVRCTTVHSSLLSAVMRTRGHFPPWLGVVSAPLAHCHSGPEYTAEPHRCAVGCGDISLPSPPLLSSLPSPPFLQARRESQFIYSCWCGSTVRRPLWPVHLL